MDTHLLWSPRKVAEQIAPISLPGWKRLAVLPYVRGRLTFAQAAAALLDREAYTSVVTDLPHFLTHGQVLDQAHACFPLALVLIVKQSTGDYRTWPLVPNDAAYMAMFAAWRRGLPALCVDEETPLWHPNISTWPAELPLRDDYLALWHGVEAYFSPHWSRMDRLWETLSPFQMALIQGRAASVARWLRGILASGGRILFVCEYRLWWAVRRILEGAAVAAHRPVTGPRSDMQIALIAEDPLRLWSLGELDDYPALTLAFSRAMTGGELAALDKLGALDGLLMKFFLQADRATLTRASLRRLVTFRRLLRNRILLSRRIVPLPVTHLLEGAKACFGKEVARKLAAALLTYPSVGGKRASKGDRFYRLRSDGRLLRGKPFNLPDLEAAAVYSVDSAAGNPSNQDSDLQRRRVWADQARRELTRAEATILGKPESGVTWAVAADYLLYDTVCALVRDLVSREARQSRTIRSWGSLEDGVDWKATMAARARGDRAIYITRRYRAIGVGGLDAHTPIVFLFSPDIDGCRLRIVHDGNLAQRHLNLGNMAFPFDRHPKPDLVYSLLGAVRKRRHALLGHIEKHWNAAITLLYTRSAMGVERYEAIGKRPERYQCRVMPQDDPELCDLSTEEQMVAWAIKYAERAVIVVAYKGWSLSERLERLARERRVKVLTIPLSTLPSGLVRRLQVTHLISTPLKRHPQRDQILRRVID